MKTQNLQSKPVSFIHGDITVPGDKSISHRSIILGAIAKGTTVINGFLNGGDCMATLKAFQDMGVSIEGPVNQQVVIQGVGKLGLKKSSHPIDCGNSGTSMRLLTGLLAPQPFDSMLTGDDSLLKRPMLRVSKPLTQMGAHIETHEGKPPVVIHGGHALSGISYAMPEASAQVKSCLLLAGMYAQGQTSITECGISRDHTERMLEAFSYPIEKNGNTLSINSKSECIGTTITVPGDISSAAFFIIAASIIPGSDLIIRNVGINPTRIGVIEILKQMGGSIFVFNERMFGKEPVADLHVRYSPLKGITILPDIVPLAIDEFPALFIAAACAEGVTTLHGARELRVKESDRIGTMVEGLQRLGIDTVAYEDGVKICGGTIRGGVVDSHGDHRIAMSFAIAGAVATSPIQINDCANVATSFPSFVKTAQCVHLHIEETN